MRANGGKFELRTFQTKGVASANALRQEWTLPGGATERRLEWQDGGNRGDQGGDSLRDLSLDCLLRATGSTGESEGAVRVRPFPGGTGSRDGGGGGPGCLSAPTSPWWLVTSQSRDGHQSLQGRRTGLGGGRLQLWSLFQEPQRGPLHARGQP